MSILVPLDGVTYRVSLAPVERPANAPVGEFPAVAVCFERSDGRWVGRALSYREVDLMELTQTQLRVLLRQAVAHG